MPDLTKINLSQDALERHTLDMRQFAGAERLALPDGQRIVRLYNAAGLTVDLLVDRALDIWRASYRGLPLTWVAPGSPHDADATAPWLRLFNGGLLTTCGLRHVGPGEVDVESGEASDLHGDVTRQPARKIILTQGWDEDSYALGVTGEVMESSLFGPQLRLERSYQMSLTEGELTLTDVLTNVGDLPQPLMVLYHVNVGYPLVRDGAELHVAGGRTPVPRDAAAQAGAEDWSLYAAPVPAYAEQVYFHRPHVDDEGCSRALIGHSELALEVVWDARAAPYLTQWKNTRDGIYVSGVEPANCLPEGRNRARGAGRLDTIEPGGERIFRVRLRAVAGRDGYREARERVQVAGDRGRESTIDLAGYPDPG